MGFFVSRTGRAEFEIDEIEVRALNVEVVVDVEEREESKRGREVMSLSLKKSPPFFSATRCSAFRRTLADKLRVRGGVHTDNHKKK